MGKPQQKIDNSTQKSLPREPKRLPVVLTRIPVYDDFRASEIEFLADTVSGMSINELCATQTYRVSVEIGDTKVDGYFVVEWKSENGEHLSRVQKQDRRIHM